MTWVDQCLRPGSNVDAVAVDVGASNHCLAELQTDAKQDSLIGRDSSRVKIAPDLDGGVHRIHDVGELSKHAVADTVDDAPPCAATSSSTF